MEDTPSVPLSLEIGDDRTSPDQLSLTARSSNPQLVPDSGLVLSNSTLVITPAPNQFGLTRVTLTARDQDGAESSKSFQLTVVPVNDPPTLTVPATVRLPRDFGEQRISLGGITSGVTNENQRLTVSAWAEDASLVSRVAVEYDSPSTGGWLVLSSATNQSGSTTIFVRVQDDGGVANGGLDSLNKSLSLEITRAEGNRLPQVQIVAPADRSVFPFSATPSLQVEAEALDPDGTIEKVEFYAGSTHLGTSRTRPFAVQWRSPEAGDYVLRAVATDNQGAQAESTIRVALADVCGTVALVCNPADPEIEHLQELLFELGLGPVILEHGNLASQPLSAYELILWHDFSPDPIPEVALTNLQQAALADRAVYFIGKDLASKGAHLPTPEQEVWKGLLHLQAGAGHNQSQGVMLTELTLSERPYPVLVGGRAGTVAAFSYPFSDPVYEALGAEGERVLGRAGDSAVLVVSSDEAAGGTGRKLTQAFRVGLEGDDASLAQRATLFKNAVWWLMRCTPCNNLNLVPSVEQTRQEDGTYSYALSVGHDGRCEAVGVGLSAYLPEQFQIISARTEKGSWRADGHSLTFQVGRLAPASTLKLEFSVRAQRPGLYTNLFVLHSSSETGGALEDNRLVLVTEVPGIGLAIRAPDQLEVWGYPPDLTFTLEQSPDLRQWAPLGTYQLNQGVCRPPLGQPFSHTMFLRAKWNR